MSIFIFPRIDVFKKRVDVLTMYDTDYTDMLEPPNHYMY